MGSGKDSLKPKTPAARKETKIQISLRRGIFVFKEGKSWDVSHGLTAKVRNQ